MTVVTAKLHPFSNPNYTFKMNVHYLTLDFADHFVTSLLEILLLPLSLVKTDHLFLPPFPSFNQLLIQEKSRTINLLKGKARTCLFRDLIKGLLKI